PYHPPLPSFPTRRSSDLCGFVRFDLVEIVELIEPQDAQLPVALVEELALIDEQLAPDDLVARRGVSAEVDPPNGVLLLLVKSHRDRKSTRLNSSHVSISY